MDASAQGDKKMIIICPRLFFETYRAFENVARSAADCLRNVERSRRFAVDRQEPLARVFVAEGSVPFDVRVGVGNVAALALEHAFVGVPLAVGLQAARPDEGSARGRVGVCAVCDGPADGEAFEFGVKPCARAFAVDNELGHSRARGNFFDNGEVEVENPELGVVEVVNAAGEGGGPVVDGLTRYDACFGARFDIGEPSFGDVACAVHRLNFAARTHGLREGGINQAGENADNGDNDEQLDERETF